MEVMPEVGRVLDAARHVADSYRGHANGPAMALLIETLDALDAKLGSAGQEPTKEEREITWAEVVEGDEILSPKTKRWYEVTRMVNMGNGDIKLNIKGAPQPIIRRAKDMTPIRRGVTGEAVEILETLWSSTVRTEPAAPKESESMITEKVDDDE